MDLMSLVPNVVPVNSNRVEDNCMKKIYNKEFSTGILSTIGHYGQCKEDNYEIKLLYKEDDMVIFKSYV